MKFSELWRELTDQALLMYGHFLVLFDSADPSFDVELERIRSRVAELASG